MAGFLSRLFSGNSKSSPVEKAMEDVVSGMIKKAGFDISFDIKVNDETKELLVDFYGAEENTFKKKDAMLLDAFQFFLTKIVQNKYREHKVKIITDCDGFRDEMDQELVDLAIKLKNIVFKKKKPVYCRALPPRERKIIHQTLSDDDQIKSRSIGDGHFKKIKIFLANQPKPQKSDSNMHNKDQEQSETSV